VPLLTLGLVKHEPRFFHATRVELKQELLTWSNSADGECIFWLSGIATGKSTIDCTDFKRYICDAVAEHPDIAKKGLRKRWKRFVVQLISKLQASSVRLPLVFVVDALDECDGETDIERLLQLFIEAHTVGPVQLRILVNQGFVIGISSLTIFPEPLWMRIF
jgi:hypothetical protein